MKAPANLIRRSGQTWKIAAGGLCLLVAVIAAGFAQLGPPPLFGTAPEWTALISAVFGLGALMFGSLAVRCPDCRARWVWMAVSEQNHNELIRWLLTLHACPKCGYGAPQEVRAQVAASSANATSDSRSNIFRSWRNIERDQVLGAIFIFPAIIVAAVLLEGGVRTNAFWVCCAIVVICLLAARRPVLLVAAAAYYAVFPLAFAAIFTWRKEAIVGFAVCAAILAASWWWLDRPDRLARQSFTAGRHCTRCNRPLQSRRLHRPIMDRDTASETHWFHRCECGEQTLFDQLGAAWPVNTAGEDTRLAR